MEESAKSPCLPGFHRDFQQIHLESRESLAKVLLKRVGDRHLAQDLVQETYLRYWKTLAAGVVIREPERWLIRVAINLAEDWRRSFFYRQIRIGLAPGTLESMVCPRMEADDPGIMMERELLRLLPLVDLRERDKVILVLRISLGFGPQMIGDLLGIGTDAARMRLFRAYRKIRKKSFRV